jgi:hypothetical protein
VFTRFPVLRPLLTITDPYLNIFRQVIPPIMGFDLSPLPAFFLLDIASQTTAVIGAGFPNKLKQEISKSLSSTKESLSKLTNSSHSEPAVV